MGYNAPSPFSQPTPAPPPPPPKTNLPMLYYGLIVVGTAAIVLAMYNLIVIKWTTGRRRSRSAPASIRSSTNSGFIEVSRSTRSRSFDNLDSFKYKKKAGASVAQEQGQGGGCGGVDSYECAVCLSVFEDGEELRKLPACKHSFHASCIDMWLYSHSDCPLCRAPVPVTASWCHRPLSTTPEEHSREVLLNSSIPV